MSRGEVAADRSGDREAIESGRRKLPDCGRCFQDSVPERPKAAALVAGFLGSVSSRAVGAGELVNRCSDSSRGASCGGGSMAGVSVGVGVLAAFSCNSRGVPAPERIDCGVEGLSGDMERARSVCKTSAVLMQGSSHGQRVGRAVGPQTCSARQSLASALYEFLFQLLHPFGILLVSLLAQLPDALHELGRVNFLGHGDGRLERLGTLRPVRAARQYVHSKARGMKLLGSEWQSRTGLKLDGG